MIKGNKYRLETINHTLISERASNKQNLLWDKGSLWTLVIVLSLLTHPTTNSRHQKVKS